MNKAIIAVLALVLVFSLTQIGATIEQPDMAMNSDFEFVRQPLDHFDPLNSRFWDQRYYWNSSNYEKHGPIFILVGGEGAIDGQWERQGTVGNLCAELNCFAFVLEHRFFGKSWPIRDTKIESLKFLTLEMALADLAHFVVEIKQNYELERSKVVVIGRSYSGELAIYFREKYPHLVDIAWGSSAPILYKYDFSEYMEFIGVVIRGVSQKCYNIVKEAFRTLVQMTSDGVGCDSSVGLGRSSLRSDFDSDSLSPRGSCPVIQKTFKLCSQLDISNRGDVANLLRQLVSGFTRIVQYNGQIQNHSVEHMCSSLFENDRIGLSPIQKIAQFTDIMNALNGLPCVDFLESTFCTQFNGTGIEPIKSSFMSSFGPRSWFWIVCTQVGSFQTLSGRNQPFGQTFFTSNFVKRCQCAFGEEFMENFIRQRVKTNLDEVFGGRRLAKRITRVIFVNGRKDPWSPLGILFQNQTTAQNKVVHIPGASHVMDMISPTPQDPPHLIVARQQIKNQLKEWLERPH